MPNFQLAPKAGSNQAFGPDDDVIRFTLCPDCDGRGYFLMEPFALRIGHWNCCQCLTCLRAKKYFDEHGELPEDLAALADKEKP